jgi:hypothetical protein
MIEVTTTSAFDTLASELEAEAAAIAEAHARTAQLADANDPARWRRPDLLWPRFGKG